jgi:hypothetical protein
MAREKVVLGKKSYKKEQVEIAFDLEFKSFKDPVPEVDTDTIEELFRLYDLLYYSIPAEGETNSHEYILRMSSELADFDKNIEEIEPLLDEIAQLRQEVLQQNQQIFELENK